MRSREWRRVTNVAAGVLATALVISPFGVAVASATDSAPTPQASTATSPAPTSTDVSPSPAPTPSASGSGATDKPSTESSSPTVAPKVSERPAPTPDAATRSLNDAFIKTIGDGNEFTTQRSTAYGQEDPVGGYAAVAGTVTGPAGAPLAAGTSGEVKAVPADDPGAVSEFRYGSFGDDGSFTVTGLSDGNYKLQIQAGGAGGTRYVTEWWQDAVDVDTATPLALAAGTVTHVSPELAVLAPNTHTGSISGTVHGPGGATLAAGTDVDVEVYSHAGEYVGGETADPDDFSYHVSGLDTGSYDVHFSSRSPVGVGYLRSWWNGAQDQSSATSVPVIDGQDSSGIDPNLGEGSAISGDVRGPGGASLTPGTSGRVLVASVAEIGDPNDPNSVYFGWGANFDETGSYVVNGLPAGEYILRISADDPADNGYRTSFLGDTAESRPTIPGAAVHVTTTQGAVAAGRDANLALAGKITGTLRGPTGGPLAAGTAGRVSAYRAGDSGYVPSAAFGDDGHYVLSGLEPGTYTLQFEFDPPTSGTGYASSWWPTAVTRGGATSIPLLVGGTVDTGTTNLPSGGAISGHIRGPGGGQLAPGTTGSVMAFDADGNSLEGQYGQGVGFDDSGAYTISNLNATTYRLRVKLEGNHYYRDEWLQSSLSIDDAEAIAVTAGNTVSGRDTNLSVTGSPTVPGRVTGLEVTPGTGQASLRWSPPANGRSAIADYVIQQSTNSGSTWTTIADGSGAGTTFTATGLTNSTSYLFRVAAVNAVGRGGFSDVSAGTPQPPGLLAQAVSGAVVKKLKVKKSAKLPRLTNQGATIVWKSKSSKVCTVKKGKVVAKSKVGTCRLTASAPATAVALPMPATAFAVKVKRK